jgi:hypothetical protein
MPWNFEGYTPPGYRSTTSSLSIYTAAYRRERRRRILGWALVAIGTVMAIVHMVTHLGRLKMVGYQDLLIGYPMAAMLVLAGFIVVGTLAKT